MAASAATLTATPDDSINFLRVCRIVLDNTPRNMREIFKSKVFSRFGHKWTDNHMSGRWLISQEKWKKRLSPKQIELLSNGNTAEWDPTLLFHALLYSSLCLLADGIFMQARTQDGKILVQISLKAGSRLAKSTARSVDFTRILKRGSTLILDLSNNMCCVEVDRVNPAEFTFRNPFRPPPGVYIQASQLITATVYVCSQQWFEIRELSFIRNNSFAHCTKASTSAADLHILVVAVEHAYTELGLSRREIVQLRAIETEPIASDSVVRKIKHYEERWIQEQHEYSVRMQGVETDIKQIKSTMSEVTTDFPRLRDSVEELSKASTDATVQAKKVAADLHAKQEMITKDFQTYAEQVESAQKCLTSNAELLEKSTADLDRVKLQQEDIAKASTKQSKILQRHHDKIQRLDTEISDVHTHIGALYKCQTHTATEVSKSISLVRQVSQEQNEVTKKLVETRAGMAVIERQLSDGAEKVSNVVELATTTKKLVQHLEGKMHDIGADVNQIKGDVELMRQDSSSEDPIQKLSPSHFESDINYYSEKHHAGTRQWLFDCLYQWHLKPALGQRSKICLLTGVPGMGKSVVAAKLCMMGKEAGILAGCFFFQHYKARRNTPKMLVQTLSYCFISSIVGYLAKIEALLLQIDLSRESASELFTYLILEPLHQLPKVSPMYIVIDALDECEFNSRDELLKLIIHEFVKLPKWISVILTSRPDHKVLQKLRKVKPVIELLSSDHRNIKDITVFLSDVLHGKVAPDEFQASVNLLVKKSEGMFLYFHYAMETLIEEESLTFLQIQSLLPDGIDDYYEQNFARIFKELGKELYQILLQVITAARSSLPLSMVAPLLQMSANEAVKAIETISFFLPVRNEHIEVFHKSIRDWLSDEKLAGEYTVNSSLGHRHLATFCDSILQDFKADSFLSCFSQNHNVSYMVKNVVYHLCSFSPEGFPEQLISTVEDIQFMYYRLVLGNGKTDELLEDFAQAQASLAHDTSLCQRVKNCSAFIQKHAQVLSKMPHLIFQCALNEPQGISDQLRVQTYLENLQQYFPEVKMYLEITKKPQETTSNIKTYTCHSSITSCAQSHDGEILICSDLSRRVYFFNKQTSKLLFTQEVSVSIHQCSLSPGGILVYGELSKAIDLDGNIVTLLENVESKSDMCLFSPDGKRVVAWNYRACMLPKSSFEYSNYPYYPQVWDLDTSTCKSLEVTQPENQLSGIQPYQPSSACFSHDGNHVACAYMDGRVLIWDTKTADLTSILYSDGSVTKKGVETLVLHVQELDSDPVYHVTYSPDGHFLAVSWCRGILIWDAPALMLLQTLANDNTPTSCSFSDDSRYILAACPGGSVRTWKLNPSLADSNLVFFPEVATKVAENLLCCFFDKSLNILCGVENILHVYSYQTLLTNTITKSAERDSAVVHPGCASNCKFLPDNKVVTCGGEHLCVWSATTGTLHDLVPIYPKSCFQLSNDGELLITYGNESFINIWKTKDFQLISTLKVCHKQKPEGKIVDLSTSAEEKLICGAVSDRNVVVGGTKKGTIYFWHGESFASVSTIKKHESEIVACKFSSEDEHFVSADRKGCIFLWSLSNTDGKLDITSTAVLLEPHANNFSQYLRNPEIFIRSSIHLSEITKTMVEVQFSPKQAPWQRIISRNVKDRALHLYHASSGDLLKKMEGHGDALILKVSFSSDGGLIASGDISGHVIVWDGSTGDFKNRINVGKAINNLTFVCLDEYICTQHKNSIRIHDTVLGLCVTRLSLSASISALCASTSQPLIMCCEENESVNIIRIHIV